MAVSATSIGIARPPASLIQQSYASICSTRGAAAFTVRASSNNNGRILDKTKRNISREEVLKNQEQNESEKRSVFGAEPGTGAGAVYTPRPEIERRPETGERSFASLMAFDGAGPETINGRLAMIGFWWAIFIEARTGQSVTEQLFSYQSPGLFYFLGVAQLFFWASIVPMFKGESPDSRSFGPFTATAERWNGRLAMIGFASLLIDELVRGSALIHM